MVKEKASFKDKIIPYALYVLTFCIGIFHEYSLRDVEPPALQRFAARNKHVIVTNVISASGATGTAAIAVEIEGVGSGEKFAFAPSTEKHLRLSSTPKVGDEFVFAVKKTFYELTVAR